MWRAVGQEDRNMVPSLEDPLNEPAWRNGANEGIGAKGATLDLHAEPAGRFPPVFAHLDKKRLMGVCAILAVGCCCYSRVSGTAATHSATINVSGKIALFDLSHIEDEYVSCFRNNTLYRELDGKDSMRFSWRSSERSPYACQYRCSSTPRCHHFSFWNDGGCHLTSYSAYPEPYFGDDLGVIAGPRSCSSMPTEPGPVLQLAPAVGLPPFVAREAPGCGGLHPGYSLSWGAQGRTFFDDWQFVTRSETHGAEWYLNKTEAFHKGVVYATRRHAILRVGDQIMPFKRRSVMLHSAKAWRPDKGFLVVMKYHHVPYGAGIWPAFWLVNSDYLWPGGGELDVLEYANDAASKVTFHTNQNCSLNRAKLDECMAGRQGMDREVLLNCYTNYTSNHLGCMPQQVRRSGEWFAGHPGVIATAWDASGISVFHIPEKEIPQDLTSGAPTPNAWGRWMIAFLPFDSVSCIDFAKPQEIVLNIALCGDWAGGAWLQSDEARATGFNHPYCIPGHVTEPATDCCTIFMSHPTSEDYIKKRAFFDIEYIKVFEPTGTEPSELSAGTYRNNGEPLEQPCVPCGTSRQIPNQKPGGGNICCPGCGEGVFTMDGNGTLICPTAA